MSTTLSLHENTKRDLDRIADIEGHTSKDSVIKSLLLYREFYLQNQDTVTNFTPTNNTPTTSPPNSYDDNGHKAYLGKIGSGKTVTTKYHIHHLLEQHPETNVIIIDPLSSHESFATRHDGISIPSDEFIDPDFTFPDDPTEISTILDSPIEEAIQTLPETNLLNICVGGEGNVSNSQTEVAAMTVLAVALATQHNTRTEIYIDQSHFLLDKAHKLFGPENGNTLMTELIEHATQHNTNLNFITQTVEELSNNEQENTTLSIIDRLQTVFLHNIDLTQTEQEQLNLSDGQEGYIRQAHTGTRVPYSEILIKQNDSWIPDRIELSDDFKKLIDI